MQTKGFLMTTFKEAFERKTKYFYRELYHHYHGHRVLSEQNLQSAVAHWSTGADLYVWKDDPFWAELQRQRTNLIQWGLIDDN